MKHRYLARRNPRAPNLRQVHLIPAELLQGLEVAGYGVEPGDLGENITTGGIDLETLPLDTELRIGDATIRLTGLRTLCVDRQVQTRAESAPDRSEIGRPFRAGVMAIGTGVGWSYRGTSSNIASIAWILPSARGNAVWVIVLITYVISLGEFSHVVAGSGEAWLLMWTRQTSFAGALDGFILPSLAGNLVGGTGLFAVLAHG